MELKGIHHIALLTGNYELSKQFYTEVLGFSIQAENYREERDSWKLDLALNGQYCIELFSFPDWRERASYPEARGLRHLAFAVEDVEGAAWELEQKGVRVEPVRVDPFTGKKFVFFYDPDNQPLELYEADITE